MNRTLTAGALLLVLGLTGCTQPGIIEELPDDSALPPDEVADPASYGQAIATASTLLVPTSDVTRNHVVGITDDAALFSNVDDGTAFSMTDDSSSYVRGEAGVAQASHTVGFSGAPAGTVTQVTVSYRANRGSAHGTVQARLYDGPTLIGTGKVNTAGSWTSYYDTFSGLRVADANALRVELALNNTAKRGALRYSQVFAGIAIARADTTPPQAAVIAPAAGTAITSEQDVTLLASAADDVGVATVGFELDGAPLASAVLGAQGWSLTYHASAAANGKHALVAVARDAAGNVGRSAAVDFSIAIGTAPPPPPPAGDPTLPLRATFYYAWFPETWGGTPNPFTHYHPTSGFYRSDDAAIIQKHLDAMVYGNIKAAFSSWWGQGHYTDTRFAQLLAATGNRDFHWALYYEKESTGNPTVAELQSDLNAIKTRYGSDPHMLRIDGKPVVFVFADATDACGMADRWKQANTMGMYIGLKVFSGYAACASQPDAWHQYAPAGADHDFSPDSYNVSPGFFLASEATPRLARDPVRFANSVKAMVASNARWQLVTSFNEWGEGTAVESAAEWTSASGFGTYLDILHANGASTPPPPANTPPTVSAGADQTLASGATVTLQGTASDADGDALTATWKQTAGPAVTLSSASALKPTFTAPAVTTATTLVFTLSVTDGKATTTDSASVTVLAPAVNHPPTVSAVAPPNAASGALVTLDGSASSDPDGDSLSFAWTQQSGPTVTLANASASKASFTTPAVTADTALAFKLTVTDAKGASASSMVSLTVVAPTANRAPVANAGADHAAGSGAAASLDGSASSDPDGDALTYAWKQTGGTAVTLSSASAAKPTFTAPVVSAATALTFSLVVTDAKGLASAADSVVVTVNPPSTVTAKFTKAVSLHAVTRSSIVVFFMTDVAVAATVNYGVSSTGEQSVTEPSPVTRHVVTLSGMTANTPYQYAVNAGGSTASGTFTTAIDGTAGTQPFTFAVAGDARGHSAWATVAKSIAAKKPRFLIQTGDNNDASGSATNWEDYYNVAKDFFANVPVFAAQGNHDTGSNFTTYNVAPQSSSGSSIYYAFVYGNAGFVAVNTNALDSTQTSWVKNALTAMSGGPMFAFHHHPLYSCGSHGSDSGLQSTFKASFEAAKLTTDFTGHDHDLIYWSALNNVHYVVSGGGGTGLYALSGCQGPFAKSSYGFMLVTVNGATITQTFYDQNGVQLFADAPFQAAGPSVPLSSLGSLVVR